MSMPFFLLIYLDVKYSTIAAAQVKNVAMSVSVVVVRALGSMMNMNSIKIM